MNAKVTLAVVRSNRNVKGDVADKWREAATKLARRNPTLSEAQAFLEPNEKPNSWWWHSS